MGGAVTGIDNLNDYYDVNLKIDRLKQIEEKENFKFLRLDLADRTHMAELFSKQEFDVVVNLAAQAGVRYSLINPHAYIENNISGFLNILRRMPASGCEAPCLCLIEFRLWGKYEDALFSPS